MTSVPCGLDGDSQAIASEARPDRRAANLRDTVRVVDRPIFEMYRDAVDQATRNDIAAATAAHHELGRDYDGEVAEGLVDRIGAEIDRRIDARLGAGSSGSRSPAEVSRSGKSEALFVGAGIGAGVTGFVAMIAAQSGEHNVVGWVVAIWVILAAAGLGSALARMYRSRKR